MHRMLLLVGVSIILIAFVIPILNSGSPTKVKNSVFTEKTIAKTLVARTIEVNDKEWTFEHFGAERTEVKIKSFAIFPDVVKVEVEVNAHLC